MQEEAQKRVQNGSEDILFLLEHPPTVSIGKHFGADNVPQDLAARWKGSVDIVHSTRGGNITCHFPGQLVAYPVINLQKNGLGLRQYVHLLEEAVIRSLAFFGMEAGRKEGFPGVWAKEEKIASLGLAVNRHVTMHGLALNVSEDLSLFNIISPCGLGVSATSVCRCLEQKQPDGKPDMPRVKEIFAKEFYSLLNVQENPRFLSLSDFYSPLHNDTTS